MPSTKKSADHRTINRRLHEQHTKSGGEQEERTRKHWSEDEGGPGALGENARRHGFSVPVQLDPCWSEEVRALTQQLAGEDAGAELRELACQIAAAQIDVVRVRRARLELIKEKLADENFQSRKGIKVSNIVAEHLTENPGSSIPPLIAALLDDERPTGANKLATIISDMAGGLKRLDRYERRALSRRKFAIRAFDQASAQASCPAA